MQQELARGSMQIERLDTDVDDGGIIARFQLTGEPGPRWQGAFSRAMQGRLGNMAGRWRFDSSSVVVMKVDPAHAAAVSVTVRDAIAAANGWVNDTADAADLAREGIALAAEQMRRDASQMQETMRAALG